MIADHSRETRLARRPRPVRVGRAPAVGPLSHYTARRLGASAAELPNALQVDEGVVWSVPHPETGLPLLELVLGSRGPSLRMYDHEGVMRVQFCACPQFGVAVEVCGENGDALAALWDLGDEGGSVHAFCREGENKVSLVAGSQAESGRLELRRVTAPAPHPEMLGQTEGASLTVSTERVMQADALER